MHAWKQHKESPCVAIFISNCKKKRKENSPFFFYLLPFIFYKIGEQEGGTGARVGGGTSGSRGGGGERE
jgi:hypothetical protein